MKKHILLFTLLLSFSALSCTDWTDKLDDMQQQIDKLKTDASGMNSLAQSLSDIITALQQNAVVTELTPIAEGGKTVGFTMTFNETSKVTVYNQPSNISFIKKDGKYYWTVGGQTLKDASGNDVEITSQAAVPVFKIEGTAIKYSLDGGVQWLSAGENLIPEQTVSLVTDDEDNVYINMTGGEKITIAKVVDLKVTLAGTGATIAAGQTVDVEYSVEGVADSLAVSTLEHDGWVVKVTKKTLSTGVLSVTAPSEITDTEVLAFFSDGRGRAVVASLDLVAALAEIVYPKPYEKDFPIMAWYSLTPEYADHQGYLDLADAGFTISLTQSYNWETDAYIASEKQLLDAAQGTGVKLMIEMQNWTIYSPDYGGDSCTVASFVNQLKNHPALYGYQILDEPTKEWLPRCDSIKKLIKSVDKVHPTYINLLPDWEQAGYASYQEYVADAFQKCDLDFFSFDKYPVHTTFVDPLWYLNLEVIRNASLTTGRPFWAFALSCGLGGGSSYPVPSVETIRLQQYVNLAYGAQGLEYFTYQDAHLEESEGSNSPIDRYGQKTPIYDVVKQVNNEIQNRAYVFKGCNVKWVRHTLADSYSTVLTKQDYPEELEYIKTSGGAVVSYIENNGSEYLMVVNKDHLKTLSLKVDFTKDVYTVEKDGSQHLLKDQEDYHLFTIDKGDTMIFKIK